MNRPADFNAPHSRRRFLAGSLAGAAAGITACSGGSSGGSPGPVTKSQRANPLSSALPKPNGLNLIVICADTTRVDHLGAYGSRRIKTPSLDQFAKESVVFENSYADGLPTIPCRRVFFTGRSILHEKQAWWRPLNADDVTLPEVLQKAGMQTAFVTDVYHYYKPNMNFHRGFDSWEFIRGQEMDPWISGPRDRLDPARHMPAHHVTPAYLESMRQYMMNTAGWKREDDYFAAQVCRSAMDWLEHNARQEPFFLWIDSFDPHEPWDAPPRYQKMYRQD
jgi:arylsulfatase A-like enzyme